MAQRRDEPGRGESFSRADRLRKRSDFLRCYRRGRRWHGALSTLHSAPNELRHPRLGITVSRKVGPAVTRFRVKRRIREIYRRWPKRSQLPAVDLVVHVKPPAGRARFDALRRELYGLFKRLVRNAGRAP